MIKPEFVPQFMRDDLPEIKAAAARSPPTPAGRVSVDPDQIRIRGDAQQRSGQFRELDAPILSLRQVLIRYTVTPPIRDGFIDGRIK